MTEYFKEPRIHAFDLEFMLRTVVGDFDSQPDEDKYSIHLYKSLIKWLKEEVPFCYNDYVREEIVDVLLRTGNKTMSKDSATHAVTELHKKVTDNLSDPTKKAQILDTYRRVDDELNELLHGGMVSILGHPIKRYENNRWLNKTTMAALIFNSNVSRLQRNGGRFLAEPRYWLATIPLEYRRTAQDCIESSYSQLTGLVGPGREEPWMSGYIALTLIDMTISAIERELKGDNNS